MNAAVEDSAAVPGSNRPKARLVPTLPFVEACLQFYRSSHCMLSCIFLLFLINQFCFALLEVPRIRLLEKVICYQYYQDRPPSGFGGQQIQTRLIDLDCKLPEIQSELANVVGILTACNAIPGLLTAIYFGKLADRIGRKPVALLSSVGELFALVSSTLICTSHIYPQQAHDRRI